jgi:hypothetical protein
MKNTGEFHITMPDSGRINQCFFRFRKLGTIKLKEYHT